MSFACLSYNVNTRFFLCVFYIHLFILDHIAHARLQADGRRDDDNDQRSRRPQPGLQSGGHHGHQGPHQHARVCWGQPAVWTQ